MTTIARLIVLPLLLGGLIAPVSAADPPASARIGGEIDRIERAWKNVVPPAGSPVAGLVSGAQASLKSAREALDAGRTYTALEQLAQAADLLRGAEAILEKGDTVKDLPSFEAEWAKTSSAIADLSRGVGAADWGRAPSALRAIAETSSGRIVPMLDGARGFATSTAPKDGLFHLGEARGQAEFARFCGSLRMARSGRPWRSRSLLPELLALQAKVDAAFVPPRSIEQHPRFIALNSALKLARELDSSKAYHGALYQYLESVRHFAMLDAPPVDAERQAAIKAAIASERARATRSATDDSIALAFLERAQPAASADEWRSADVTLKQVLPAYAGVLESAPALEAKAGKTIDVTLVRWPYT